MKPERPSLQDLLAVARTQPAFLPKDDAYRNFRQRSLESSSPATAHPFNTRTFILAGGVMAVIVAIVFVLSSFLRTSVQEATLAVPPNTPPAAMAAVADDSIKNVKGPAVIKPEVSGGTRVLLTGICDMPDTEPVIASEHRYPPTSFVSCTPERVDTFTPIELTPAELKNLGLYITADGFLWYQLFPDNPDGIGVRESVYGLATSMFGPVPKREVPLDSADAVLQKGSVIDTVRRTITGFPKLGPYIWPVMVSSKNGRCGTTVGELLSNAFTPPDLRKKEIPETIMTQTVRLKSGEIMVQDLVPIRIVKPKVPGDPPGHWDFWVYWYEPTAELLAALPERVQKTIQQDKELRRRRIEKSKYNDELPKPLTLEACIFPNPVTQDRATVHYSLPEAGRVAMALYDITGKRLRDFALCEDRREGNWEDQVSLHGIAPGLYVLAVTTDRGEQAIQKVVVQR